MLQQLRWARAAGGDPAKAESRLGDIAAVATSLGYKPILDKGGRRVGAGQQMPSVTDLIGTILDEEAHYRLLSAVAHGHHWALQELSLSRAPHFDTTSTLSGTHLSALTKGANITAFAAFTLIRAIIYLTHPTLWRILRA